MIQRAHGEFPNCIDEVHESDHPHLGKRETPPVLLLLPMDGSSIIIVSELQGISRLKWLVINFTE